MNETRISELRKGRGWTQERLAEASGVTVRTIQRLESGSDASLDTLARIADALGVQVTELFAHVEDEQFLEAVNDLDARKRGQQQRRDAVVLGFHRAVRGVGVLVLFATFALIAAKVLPGYGFLIVPAYFAGVGPLAEFLFRVVASPRLDEKYPLSVPSRLTRHPFWPGWLGSNKTA